MKSTPSGRSPTTLQALVACLVGLMTASLFWLAASSRLAAIGVQMDWLREHRMVLLQERSEALARYAAATDPGAMERRAARLGLHSTAPEGAIALRGGDLDRSGGGGLGQVLVARRSAAGAQAALPHAGEHRAEGAIGSELAAALAEIRSGGR